jgi:hypothetical protein
MEVEGAGLLAEVATCCARTAALFTLLAFVGLTDAWNCLLQATGGPRQVCFGGLLLVLPGGSHEWPSSPSCPPHFPCLPLLHHLFLHHFQSHLEA